MRCSSVEDYGDAAMPSTRFRCSAIKIIKHKGRPMASIEVRESLRKHEPELCDIVCKKCGDYARIILSHSEKFGIVKFKPRVPHSGIDRRTVYYGLIDENYNQNEWIPVGDWFKHKSNKSSRKSQRKAKFGENKSRVPSKISIIKDAVDTEDKEATPKVAERMVFPPIPEIPLFPSSLEHIMNDFIGIC